MNKYLVKLFEVDIDCDDVYYPVDVIEDMYIDADSSKQAFLEFVKRLENDCGGSYGFYDVRYDLIRPIPNVDTGDHIVYEIDLYCTLYDLGIYDKPTKLSANVEQVKGEEVKGEEVKKYLIESTFINLIDDSVDYYETDAIPSRCIEARSLEEALRVFLESLERDEELGYYDIKYETLNPCLRHLVVPNSETIGYTIDASCTWVDTDCYTHDDGPVELTFAVTCCNRGSQYDTRGVLKGDLKCSQR